MNDLNLLQLGMKATFVLFSFAFGACAGSLINVLVYRLPRGMDAVWASSHCPCCQTKLTWRENIPVFGWIALGGRCRFCRSKISAEYPLVEGLVGLLWAAIYLFYYALPEHARFLGVDWGAIRPTWALSDIYDAWPRTTWSLFLVHLFIVASLVAMTLVDAKTFTIPLALPWAALVFGIIFHTLGAAIVQFGYPGHLRTSAPGAAWGIPTPDWPGASHTGGWWWIGASVGGTGGLLLANVLLHFKLIRRSFADYPDWEREALKAQGIDVDAPGPDQPDEGVPVGEHVGPGVHLVIRFTLVWLAVALGLGVLGHWAASHPAAPFVPSRGFHMAQPPALRPYLPWPSWVGLAIGFLAGPFIAAIACRPLSQKVPRPPPPAHCPTMPSAPGAVSAPPASASPTAPDMWIAYPYARREMVKELIFLTPVVALGWLGGFLAQGHFATVVPPLWLLVLCGTLMGILIGGGGVWLIRIGGSLAFGKEAMGLGDVHLIAAVGACLGWVDALLAIPLAAVVGLIFVILAMLAGRPTGRAMPFGPYLAVGALLVLFGRPLVELGLTTLIRPSGPPVFIP